MAWSWTTTSVSIDSMRLRAVVVSTSVTREIHSDDRRGVRTGTVTIGTVARCARDAARRSISAYVRTSGPPISNTRPIGLGWSSTPTR